MRVMVTGANGYVGRHLAQVLRQNKAYQVVEAGRQSFHYTDIESIRIFFQENPVDKVVHLAGAIEGACAEEYYSMNVQGLHSLLTVCMEEHIDQFLYASNNTIYHKHSGLKHFENETIRPEELDLYARTKYMGELMLHDLASGCGMTATVLRIGDIYGYRQKYGNLIKAMVRAISEGSELIQYGKGERTRDYIYIDDVVRGIVHAIENKIEGIYNLATGKGTSVLELIRIAERISNGRCKIVVKDAIEEDKTRIILGVEKFENTGFHIHSSLEDNMTKIVEREMGNGDN